MSKILKKLFTPDYYLKCLKPTEKLGSYFDVTYNSFSLICNKSLFPNLIFSNIENK